MEQQRMQTFPDYDAEIAKVENLGLVGPGMALKKRANWISFIKVRRPVVTVTCEWCKQCHKVSSREARQPGSIKSVRSLLSPLLNALSKLSPKSKGRCLPDSGEVAQRTWPCVPASPSTFLPQVYVEVSQADLPSLEVPTCSCAPLFCVRTPLLLLVTLATWQEQRITLKVIIELCKSSFLVKNYWLTTYCVSGMALGAGDTQFTIIWKWAD